MTLVVVTATATLALATYLSALALALMTVSRSALEEGLERSGHSTRAEWFFAHADEAQLAVSLLRTICRLGFFAIVLAEIGGVAETTAVRWRDIGVAGAIAVPLLWIFSTVLASAIARHASVGLVRTSLPVLQIVTAAFMPLTRALSFIDEAVRRLSGANLKDDGDRAEALLRSIDDTHREGGLDERSVALLENVVEFSSTDVGEVMTPRTDIEGIALTDDLADIRAFIDSCGHSRIPVYEGSLDQIVGVLYVKDLVHYLGRDAPDFALRPILRQPIVVPETKPVRELLADFQKSEVHLAIVIDEYGGTAGLVTIEDVLEEIVGEIHDEHEPEDEEEPTLTPIDERRVEVDGRYHIDDLNEHLGLALPEDEEYDTVAGYVLATLGHVPVKGEAFEANDARFTALAATPTHVQRIGVELLREPVPANGDRRGEETSSPPAAE